MFVANSDQLLGRWLVDDFDYFRKIFIEPKLVLFRIHIWGKSDICEIKVLY
jgi:hypothetical protein